jgi:tetratricopeptide (TPR) repeat protein
MQLARVFLTVQSLCNTLLQQKASNPLILGNYFLLLIITATPVYAHGLTHDRLQTLDHAIAHSPKEPALYLNRGRIYQDSGLWDDALLNYAQALQIDTDFNEAIYWQGKAYFQKGDYKKAEITLQKYLSREFHAPAGHRSIAKVYSRLGDNLKAAEHYDQAINNDQNPSPQIYLERTRTLLKIDPIPVKRINSGLVDAINRHGQIVTFLDLLIDLNIKTANYQEAIVWLEKLPTNLKNTPLWLTRKGAITAFSGHRNEAKKLFRMALEGIAALPEYKQNLPAFVIVRYQAEQGILQLK